MAHPVPHSRRFRFGSRHLLACALLAALVATWSQPARADGPRRKDQYKHQVEKLEQAWRTAQLNGDVDAMDKLLSDDYVGITMSGQVVTKMQQLDRMRNRVLSLTRMELDDVKVKLIGTTAIVTSHAEVEGTNEGIPIHGNYRYTRVYTHLPSGAWKITNFEATRVGPPMGPGGPHGPSADAPATPAPPPQ